VEFSHASPFHNPKALNERLFTFGKHDLRIKQNWKPDGKGGTEIGFGAAVYEAAFILADFIACNPSLFRDKSAIELGCGVGLVSLVCSCFGAAPVVATDGDAGSVRFTQDNINHNAMSSVVEAKLLLWGNPSHMGTFDNIVASDVVCFQYEDSFYPLVQTLCDLTKVDSSVWITYKRRHKNEDLFFEIMQNYFLLVETIPPQNLHKDYINEGISLLHFKRNSVLLE